MDWTPGGLKAEPSGETHFLSVAMVPAQVYIAVTCKPQQMIFLPMKVSFDKVIEVSSGSTQSENPGE